MPNAGAVRAAVEQEVLGKLAGPDAGKPDAALKITGLEILAFVAGKIVVPIVIAFAKDVLLDEYKRIRNKKQLDQARDALAKAELAPKPRRDLKTVRDEAIAAAIEEGLSEERARLLVDGAIESVQAQVGAA
jgi:D-aminopeptidase